MLKYISIFLNSKWSFVLPKKSSILVYNSQSINFANILFSKKSFEVYEVGNIKINIPILILSVFKFGFKNISDNYKKVYLTKVNPKLIYTCIDNSIGFFKLKNLYPSAIYIADQNGMRDNNFFLTCKKYTKETKKKLVADYFFCFGKNDKNKLKKIIKGKILILGSTINNEFNKFSINSKKIKKLIFISSTALHALKIDDMIFKNLIKYKLKKRMDLVYLDKPQGYITKDISPNMRRKKFLEMYGKDFTYYSGKKFNDSYKLFNDNAAIIFAGSTLGYEAFASGKRCISFNHQKYHYDYKYKKQGEFWNQNRDFKSITSIINKVLNYNTTDWSNIYKKYSKQILVFDKNNKTKKSIINKILGKK